MTSQVQILKSVVFTRGVNIPFRNVYRLQYIGFQGPLLPLASGDDRVITCDYEGTPLATLRKIAKKIAKENGASVVEMD